MPLSAACPSCHATFRASTQLIGKRVKCPKCGSLFVVADPSPTAAAGQRAQPPAASHTPASPPDASADSGLDMPWDDLAPSAGGPLPGPTLPPVELPRKRGNPLDNLPLGLPPRYFFMGIGGVLALLVVVGVAAWAITSLGTSDDSDAAGDSYPRQARSGGNPGGGAATNYSENSELPHARNGTSPSNAPPPTLAAAAFPSTPLSQWVDQYETPPPPPPPETEDDASLSEGSSGDEDDATPEPTAPVDDAPPTNSPTHDGPPGLPTWEPELAWRVGPDAVERELAPSTGAAAEAVHWDAERGRVWLPRRPSRYLLIDDGQAIGAMRGPTLWDLATGRPRGKVPDPMPNSPAVTAMSPSGRLFAAAPDRAEPAYLLIYSLPAWTTLASLDPQPGRLGEVRAIDFTHRDLLLIAAEGRLGSKNPILTLIDPRTKQDQWAVEVPEAAVSQMMTLSPGGRFAALPVVTPTRTGIRFYNADTGEEAGELPLHHDPDNTAESNPRNKDSIWLHGLGFAPDGAEVGVLFSDPQHRFWFALWEIKTGQRIATTQVVGDWAQAGSLEGLYRNFNYHGPRGKEPPRIRLEWLDADHLLLGGSTVVHRETGRVVRELDSSPPMDWPRSVLASGQVLTGNAAGSLAVTTLDPDNLATALADAERAEEEARAAALVAARAEAEAAAVAARQLAERRGEVVLPPFAPNPAPARVADLLRQPVPIPLNANPAQIQLRVARNFDGPAVVSGDTPDGPRSLLIDLTGALPARPLSLPPDSGPPLAISPDGSRLAVQMPDADVIILALPDLQEIARWPVHTWRTMDSPIQHADFIDNDTLIVTYDNDDFTYAIRTADGKRRGDLRSSGSRSAHGITPGGTYLWIHASGSIYFYHREAPTQLDVRVPATHMAAPSFTPDGTRVFGLARDSREPSSAPYRLVSTDLAGNIRYHMDLAAQPSPIQWVGDDHLFIKPHLVHLPAAALVWQYAVYHHPQDYDSRLWHITRTADGLALAATAIPSDHERSTFASTPRAHPILGPGNTFTIEAPFTPAAREALEQRLIAEGLRPATATTTTTSPPDFRLTHQVDVESRTEDFEIKEFGLRASRHTTKETATYQVFDHTLRWVDASGGTHWQKMRNFNEFRRLGTLEADDASIASALTRKRAEWANDPFIFNQDEVPHLLFPPKAPGPDLTAGTTDLTTTPPPTPTPTPSP